MDVGLQKNEQILNGEPFEKLSKIVKEFHGKDEGMWAKCKAIEAQVSEWRYYSNTWYSPLSPIRTQLLGYDSGELIEKIEMDSGAYAYGFDADERLLISRCYRSPKGFSTLYYLDGNPLLSVPLDEVYFAVRFSEMADGSWFRWEGTQGYIDERSTLRLVVGIGAGEEMRSRIEKEGSLLLFCQGGGFRKVAKLKGFSGLGDPTERVVDSHWETEYQAELDESGQAKKIWNAAGTLVFGNKKGNPKTILKEIFSILHQRAIVLLENSKMEIGALILVTGEERESIPAICLVPMEALKKAKKEFGWRAWEPSRWQDKFETEYFDDDKSLADLVRQLDPWLVESNVQLTCVEETQSLAHALNQIQSSEFVSYVWNYESDAWTDSFKASVTDKVRDVLIEKNLFPSE